MERKERKTYRMVLDAKTVDRLIDQLYENGYEHADFSEGCTVDNHLFFLADNISKSFDEWEQFSKLILF